MAALNAGFEKHRRPRFAPKLRGGSGASMFWTKDAQNNSCYDFAVSRGLIV
jgi:hypothetical protein